MCSCAMMCALPAAQSDSLVALAWSPLETRRALVTATRRGKLVVWSQTPSEAAPHGVHVRALNRWYGLTLADRAASAGGGAKQPAAGGAGSLKGYGARGTASAPWQLDMAADMAGEGLDMNDDSEWLS